MLTKKLLRKRVDEVKALLKPLESQARTGFRHLIIGYMIWIFRNTGLSLSNFEAEEKCLIRPKVAIASERAMLTVFWKVREVILVNWFSRGRPFNTTYFGQEIFTPFVAALQGRGRQMHYRVSWSIWIIPRLTI
jgi:hypothetical protein